MPYTSRRASSLKLGDGTVIITPAPVQEINNVPEKVDFSDLKQQWFSEVLEVATEQTRSMLAPFLQLPPANADIVTVEPTSDVVLPVVTVPASDLTEQRLIELSNKLKDLQLDVIELKANLEAVIVRYNTREQDLKHEMEAVQMKTNLAEKAIVIEEDTSLVFEIDNLKARVYELESTAKKPPTTRRGAKKETVQIII